jgi:YidC/Oxa1 family membrane protein insertase
MNEHKNTILAIVLSLIVVVGWEYFFAKPELQQQQAQQQTQTKPGGSPGETQPAAPGATPRNRPPRHVRR